VDDAELDFRNMGVRRLRKRALERIEWASVMRKVKGQSAKEEKNQTSHPTSDITLPTGTVLISSVS
jgi:hypothetical protein